MTILESFKRGTLSTGCGVYAAGGLKYRVFVMKIQHFEKVTRHENQIHRTAIVAQEF